MHMPKKYKNKTKTIRIAPNTCANPFLNIITQLYTL